MPGHGKKRRRTRTRTKSVDNLTKGAKLSKPTDPEKNAIDETIEHVIRQSQQTSDSLSDIPSPGHGSQSSDDESFVFSLKQQRDDNTLVLMISTLHQEIADLSALVKSQSKTICQLQMQVSTMSEFFGISTKMEPQSTKQIVSTVANCNNAPMSDVSFPVPSAPGQSISTSGQESQSAAGGARVGAASYAAVTAKFTDSVMIAMHIDQTERKQRASSVIVSGLAENTCISDIDLFSDLCINELGIHADVSMTKRLGREIQDKIKPLLVQLKDDSQAQLLISSGKQLRHSTKEHIRNNVYINANLTKAESLAAFQLREKRRQNAAQRRDEEAANRVVSNTFYRSHAPIADQHPLAPPNSGCNQSASRQDDVSEAIDDVTTNTVNDGSAGSCVYAC